jgi:hypothetical protein
MDTRAIRHRGAATAVVMVNAATALVPKTHGRGPQPPTDRRPAPPTPMAHLERRLHDPHAARGDGGRVGVAAGVLHRVGNHGDSISVGTRKVRKQEGARTQTKPHPGGCRPPRPLTVKAPVSMGRRKRWSMFFSTSVSPSIHSTFL